MGQTNHDVEVSSNVFTPEDITIELGDTVTWTNVGGFHNVDGRQSTYPDNPATFYSGPASSGWTYFHVFDVPGFYDYECNPHAGLGMVGTVSVNCPGFMAEITEEVGESCAGACDGEAVAEPSGGDSPFSFEWSDGQMSGNATGLCAGTYTVTITDNNGCTSTASATIQAGESVTASATVDQEETCEGDCDGQATASGGTSYMWSDGQMTATATNLCAGSYEVTVSDVNGCSDVASITIQSGTSVTATATVIQDESCIGLCDGQAIASGGTSYEWSDGQMSATATDLCPGSYGVTVSDINGCSDETTVTISDGGNVIAAASVDQHETCQGDCDGQATASGGTDFIWSDGQTSATAVGLCPGSYDVTVTDGNGCSDVASVTIDAGSPSIDPTFSFPTSFCSDDPPVSLPTTSDNDIDGNWIGTGVSNNTFDPEDAGLGNWDVTFTPDPGLCANTATVTLEVEDCGCQNPPSADAGDDQEVCATADVSIVLDGSINGVSTASWSTSGSGSFDDTTALDAVYTPSQADKDSGSVTLTLTTADPDGAGPCNSASDEMVISLLFQPAIIDYVDVSVCFGLLLPEIPGDVTDSVSYFSESGGMGTQFEPGDTINETMTLYAFDVTAEGCSDEITFTITVNELSADAGADTSVQLGTAALLSGAAGAGSGEYAFAWTPDSLVVDPDSSMTETVPIETTQIFTLEVTDLQTTCVVTDQVVAEVMGGPLMATLDVAQNEICQGDSTELSVLASGGSGNYTYSWSSDPIGLDTSGSEVTVAPGEETTYSVSVSDGIDTMVLTTVIEVVLPPLADAGEDQYLCFGTPAVEICAADVTDVTYQWNGPPGAMGSGRCDSLFAGQWELIVTNAQGCQSSDSILIEELDALTVELHPDTTVTITGGLAPYDTLYIENGDTLQVAVTDANGCMATDQLVSTSIGEPSLSESIQVYPNPVQDRLQIRGWSGDGQLELWDFKGKMHLQTAGPVNEVQLNHLSSGSYILLIRNSRSIQWQQQIVIVR